MPKALHNFFLTVPHFEYKDVISTILEHELQANSYVVSTEKHESLETEQHIHAYFQLPYEAFLPTLLQQINESLKLLCAEDAPRDRDWETT